MSLTLLPIIPNILQVLPFAVLFSVTCANVLRVHPVPFYVAWTAVAAIATWGGLADLAPTVDRVVQLFASSYVGVSFYLIVMFVGALDRTPVVKTLLSIRTELSVIGGIVVAGHLVRVFGFLTMSLTPMWGEIWGHPAAEFMFAAAVVVGLPLTVTFFVPWITSFRTVRRRMKPITWKRAQKLAYPFMFLMVAQGFLLAMGHVLYGFPYDGQQVLFAIMTDPAAWLGNFAQQVATAWTYLAFGASYLVLRLRKRAKDRARRAEVLAQATPAASEEAGPALSDEPCTLPS